MCQIVQCWPAEEKGTLKDVAKELLNFRIHIFEYKGRSDGCISNR